MAGWTLLDIRTKVRAVTGRPSPDQITDSQLNDYINNYYVYTMPFELKEQITNQFLTFKTTPGTDIYSFPGGYFTDQPGAYADGYPMIFYQDPDIFYQDWPQQYAVDNIATGDGVTTNFTGGLQNPPLIIGTLFITADDPTGNQQILQDQGDGTLLGNGTGTINYLTGAYTANFNTAPAQTATIYAKYQGYAANRPQGVLFFNNQFTLRPVPDQAYQIQMQGYIKPVTLALDSDTPLQIEWGPLIAYGASLELFEDSGDTENFDRYYPVFKRFENVALGRTIQQLTSEQSIPRF
jgi:hypothetical protein